MAAGKRLPACNVGEHAMAAQPNLRRLDLLCIDGARAFASLLVAILPSSSIAFHNFT